MYHVSTQGVDEHLIDIHYYYYYKPNVILAQNMALGKTQRASE